MSLGRGKARHTALHQEFMQFCIDDRKRQLNEKMLRKPYSPKLDTQAARSRLLNVSFRFYLPWLQQCRRTGLGLVCLKILRGESGEL